MRANLYVLCLSAFLTSNVTAAISTPDQFAYQSLVTESTQALQRVELPVEILLTATRAEIAFPVYELIFLGNDNIPYTLAWGNHESDVPANDLINLLSTEQQQQPPSQLVQLGSR